MSHSFSSPLAERLQAFLAFKRSLGHPYRRAEYTLHSFDRFVQQRSSRHRPINLQSLILGWLGCVEGRKPVSVTNELGVLREFCRFLRRTDSTVVVPDRNWAPQSTESQFLPHVFSEEQIRTLLGLAKTVSGSPFRSKTIRALILILYCTGLRFGEAIRLKLRDVDLKQSTLFVRDSKRKSRWVPFGEDLATVLQDYRDARDRLAPPAPGSALFVRPDGVSLSVAAASSMLRSLLRRAGMKPPRGRIGPRPYDFRHTYAVHRLTRWYHEGVDIHSQLPMLSAYMGHTDLSGTEKYLTATPELLEIAASRFEARLRNLKDVKDVQARSGPKRSPASG